MMADRAGEAALYVVTGPVLEAWIFAALPAWAGDGKAHAHPSQLGLVFSRRSATLDLEPTPDGDHSANAPAASPPATRRHHRAPSLDARRCVSYLTIETRARFRGVRIAMATHLRLRDAHAWSWNRCPSLRAR